MEFVVWLVWHFRCRLVVNTCAGWTHTLTLIAMVTLGGLASVKPFLVVDCVLIK